MTPMKSRVEEIRQMLEIHPKGSHFCTTTKESGFVLNAEYLKPLLTLLQDAMEAMQELNTHFATDLSVVADSPMAKAVNKARAVLDRWESL
jgi:hypothetical protein